MQTKDMGKKQLSQKLSSGQMLATKIEEAKSQYLSSESYKYANENFLLYIFHTKFDSKGGVQEQKHVFLSPFCG